MYQVQGKWALITGAARAIGYLTALFMAEQGCNLILHSRDLTHTEKVLSEVTALGVSAHAVAADLNDLESVKTMLDEIDRLGVQVDIVLNNAGLQVAYRTDYLTTLPEAICGFIDDSLTRLQAERLDMILLHCPPTSVFARDDIFGALDKQKAAGKLASYGVSIEKIDEGLQAMEYDISAIEVIFNMMRLKPLDRLFPEAIRKNVGIIARVPLASGLLTGYYTKDTVFGEKDPRTYNRNGEAFDKGETFSGVPYDLALEAVARLKKVFGDAPLAPIAIRWVLMQKAVSVVIPGASRASQLESNVHAAELPALTDEQMAQVTAIYDDLLRESIHPQW